MKINHLIIKIITLVVFIITLIGSQLFSQENPDWKKYVNPVKEYIYSEYEGVFREPAGILEYHYLVPGSDQYSTPLWDWDSWWTNIALRQILADKNSKKEKEAALKYEKGCVLNFLQFGGVDGWLPYMITPESGDRWATMKWIKEYYGGEVFDHNMHKPCLAQHAAFIIKNENGDASWLREKYYHLQCFVDAYYHHYRSRKTGLYFFANDKGTGTDNDPTQYYRPRKSTATPYQNSLMYKELLAMEYIANQLNLGEIAQHYQKRAEELKVAMHEHSWDPLLGYYFSVDLNLLPADGENTKFHVGMPLHYNSLLIRYFTWTGFCAMWAGLATEEQAKIMVEKHFHDTANLNSPYGIRTLSKQEKMYYVGGSGNPSSWLGPVWIVSNYMVFKGLLNYGFEEEAREMASETIVLLGRDIERYGGMHEYYQPSNGEPVLNIGFLNWNMLVMNMIAWMEGRDMVEEF